MAYILCKNMLMPFGDQGGRDMDKPQNTCLLRVLTHNIVKGLTIPRLG